MPCIYKFSFLFVLLLVSAAFAEDKKDDSQGTSNSYEYQTSRAEMPSRDMVIIGSQTIRGEMQRNIISNMGVNRGLYISSKNENLIYSILPRRIGGRVGRGMQFSPSPSKEISIDERSPISRLSEAAFTIQILLNKIPSPADSEEIRQKNLDLACEDFQKKLQVYQEKIRK